MKVGSFCKTGSTTERIGFAFSFPASLRVLCVLFASSLLPAAEQNGTVQLAGVPVPGAIVTATANDHKLTTVTDQQGTYAFPDLSDGAWILEVEMPGFAPLRQAVTVGAEAAPVLLELKMLPFAEIVKDHPPGSG